MSRAQTARNLAQSHSNVEPDIQLIVRITIADEPDDGGVEPVKLLEVNPNTVAVGIQPIYFTPDVASGIRFPSVVIEVTPEEYQQIREQRLPLPHGWQLADEVYRRPEAA